MCRPIIFFRDYLKQEPRLRINVVFEIAGGLNLRKVGFSRRNWASSVFRLQHCLRHLPLCVAVHQVGEKSENDLAARQVPRLAIELPPTSQSEKGYGFVFDSSSWKLPSNSLQMFSPLPFLCQSATCIKSRSFAKIYIFV